MGRAARNDRLNRHLAPTRCWLGLTPRCRLKAFAALPPPQGPAATQSINVAAPTPVFMALLMGTGVTCLALAVSSVVSLDDRRAPGPCTAPSPA